MPNREYLMRKILITFFILFLILGIPTSARSAPIQEEQPVVHAILFWSNGCSYCSQVLTNILPTLQDKYNSRLSILLIELANTEDIDTLYTLGSTLGLAKEQVSVPFLLIDHTTLVGANEIRDKLPKLIDDYLSAGGLGYPNLPQLDKLLLRGVVFTSYNPNLQLTPQIATDTKATGMALAWVIMAFMVLAIILAVVRILRAFQGKPIGKANRWMDIAIPVLSIIGLGVSVYLTYVEFTHARALCGPVGDCNAVQSSPFAKLFGVVPIGLVGAIGYIAILVAWVWRRFRNDSLARLAGPVMFGMALFGTLFSVYLTYLELFVIHAVCIWCLSSAVLITVLMLLNLPAITQWLAISDEEQ
jgi:uncharacterized membrane protein